MEKKLSETISGPFLRARRTNEVQMFHLFTSSLLARSQHEAWVHTLTHPVLARFPLRKQWPAANAYLNTQLIHSPVKSKHNHLTRSQLNCFICCLRWLIDRCFFLLFVLFSPSGLWRCNKEGEVKVSQDLLVTWAVPRQTHSGAGAASSERVSIQPQRRW